MSNSSTNLLQHMLLKIPSPPPRRIIIERFEPKRLYPEWKMTHCYTEVFKLPATESRVIAPPTLGIFCQQHAPAIGKMPACGPGFYSARALIDRSKGGQQVGLQLCCAHQEEAAMGIGCAGNSRNPSVGRETWYVERAYRPPQTRGIIFLFSSFSQSPRAVRNQKYFQSKD